MKLCELSKPILGFVFVVGLCFSIGARANQELEEEKFHWSKTNLSLQNAPDFFNNEVCFRDARYLRSCIEAIRSLARWSETPVIIQLSQLYRQIDPSAVSQKEIGFLGLFSPKLTRDSAISQSEQRRLARQNSEIERIAINDFIAKTLATAESSKKMVDFADLFYQVAVHVLPDSTYEAMAVGQALSEALRWQKNDAHLRFTVFELEKKRLESSDRSVVGIGVDISDGGGGALVQSVFDGGPASAGGILPGDLIVEVNGQSLESVSLNDAVKLITGQEDTPVQLIVIREDQPVEVNLIRKRVVVSNVSAKEIVGIEGQRIGYIRIRHFSDAHLCSSVREKIEAFEAQNVTSLMVDLRDNAGGSLQEAVCLSGLFIGRKTVVNLRAPNTSNFKAHVSRQEKVTDLPLVVLLNARSASASEVFAGAIQDEQRGVLFGYPTFGKGSVQTLKSTNLRGISIFETTDRFYSPRERPIHGLGVMPDIESQIEEGEFVQRYQDTYADFIEFEPEDAVNSTPASEIISVKACMASLDQGNPGASSATPAAVHQAVLDEAVAVSSCLQRATNKASFK